MKRHDHTRCVEDALATARTLCAARGRRLTPLREQVLELIWRSHKPIGAYDVLDRLAETHKGARPPTVYRAIDFLMAEGLIHKVQSMNAFLGCQHPDEPHEGLLLICEACGEAEEIDDAPVRKAIASKARDQGFAMKHAMVEVTGECAGCRTP